MSKLYKICCEISGPTTMWTRPDTGDAPISYPVPLGAADQGNLRFPLRIALGRP